MQQNQPIHPHPSNAMRPIIPAKSTKTGSSKDDDNNSTSMNPTKSKSKSKSKYPREVWFDDVVWLRYYDKKQSKYFYECGGKTSWNPWHDNQQIAPWLTQHRQWTKFVNDGREYYFNYKTLQTTFDRPSGYESDNVSCDSTEYDY